MEFTLTWPRARAVLFSASLRARLALLALLTMVPLVVGLVAGAFNTRADMLLAGRQRAMELARLGAEQQGNVLEEAKSLLTVLSRLPGVTGGDLEQCRDLLKQVLDDHPHMAEFALMDAHGAVQCTNRSVRPNLDLLSRPYVSRLLAPGAQGFDTSDLKISRTSGVSMVFVGLSLQPKPGTDQPSGVLVAGLNLGWMSGLASNVAQGTDNIAFLFHTPDGAILARYPDGVAWDEHRVADGAVLAAYNHGGKQAGTTEGTGADGVARIYSFVPLPGMDNVVLTIGLSRAELFSLANQRMTVALCMGLAAVLAATAAAWLAAWRMIICPVGDIMEISRRLGAGDLSARTAIPAWHAPELQLLAGTLNTMADRFASSQQRLAESETGFRLLAENADDMVARVGPDGIPRYVSPAGARIFGRPTDTLTTCNLTDLMHPDDRARAKVLQASLLSGAIERADIRYRVLLPDGGELWGESALHTMRDPNTGALDGYMSVARDVTARHQIEDERAVRADEMQTANVDLERLARHLAKARDKAERASRAKTQFLAGMSHELRTPLNGVLGYAHLLQLQGGLNPLQAGHVDAMLGAGAHLLQMINCVLDLSEIEANKFELQIGELDLHEIARTCIDVVRPMAEAKSLVVGLAVAEGAPRALTSDLTRLRQMMLNLLGNAVKFTDHGGVELRLLAPAGAVFRIEVADTGPGIPARHQDRLFQDFERFQNQSSEAVEGAGLGLAITSRLATLMGGRIGYEDNITGGSVFWIELPTAIVVTGAALAVSDPQLHETLAAALHILVVDDIAMNRDIAGSFLTAAGHSVMFADGGAAAVELAASINFDVVLMDVRMPGIDGLEAARRIRALDGARARVPIVALTAQAFADQIAKCAEAGMSSHLSKPFTPNALLNAVLKAVANARMAQSTVAPGARVGKSAPTGVGADLPIINAEIFERTCAFLAPNIIETYLQTISERSEVILRELRLRDSTLHSEKLLAATHALAGSSGLFGFERLSIAGRRFEHAVQAGAPDVPALAARFSSALEDTLAEVRNRVPVLHEAD